MASTDFRFADGQRLATILRDRGDLAPSDEITVRQTVVGAEFGWTGEVRRIEWITTDGRRAGAVVAKRPGAAHPFERSMREVRFYERLADACPIILPSLLAHHADAAAGAVELLFSEVRGCNGDVVTGCTVDQATLVIDAIGALHAHWSEASTPDTMDWLPRWGAGTLDDPRPHRRRADRYRRRLPRFLATFGDLVDDALRRVLESLDDALEDAFARAFALPTTLIHADLHLDNIMWRRGDGMPVILDWQSVSRGPGVYDVVRFASESVDADDPSRIDGLIRRYDASMRRAGGCGADAASVRAILRGVVAGVVSGFGGWDRATMTDRQVEVLRVVLSPSRLGGFAVAHLDGD